jgi:hypothetical protein
VLLSGREGALRRTQLVAGLAAVALTTLTLAACSSDDGGQLVGAQPSVSPSIYPLTPSTTEPLVASAEADEGPLGAFTHNADGVVLPDPDLTPGATFPDVDAAAICELHYTQGVRQPRFNTKVASFANYGIDIHDRDTYQVDHLVPVSLGGSNAEENLWPQPYDDVAGAEQKDLLERQLRGLVCSHKLALADAQKAVATDWWSAYETYMGLPIDPGSDGPPQPTRREPAPGEVTNGAPCDREGAIGYTEPKRVKLTCTRSSWGVLRWQKRY